MSDNRTAITAVRNNHISYEKVRTELFRKGIHIMVAFVPAMAAINITVTQLLLGTAVIIYSVSELYRLNGGTVMIISGITAAAARERDKGGFIMGPVTLATGAMLALMLYPSTAATIAIYALAFGDSLASLVGKFFGRIRIPGLRDKTLEGSLACTTAVFITTAVITSDPVPALAVAVSATLLELVPVKDLDNLLIPVGTGFIAVLVL